MADQQKTEPVKTETKKINDYLIGAIVAGSLSILVICISVGVYLGLKNTAEGDSVEEASTGPSLTRLTMKEFAGVVASPKTRSLAEQPSTEDF